MQQVEKLYKRMIKTCGSERAQGSLDAGVRTEIFQKIMDDVERLIKKRKGYTRGTKEYNGIDHEIRKLLLKEIQVIIDDYIIAERNGTLESWKNMYGDIKQYIRDFYAYRDNCLEQTSSRQDNNYGFYDQEEVP